VPHLRSALGLDAPAVQHAYLDLYSKPLETIFAPSVTLLDRLRWGWSALAGWFEALPPFWTVFSLTLTETVGAGILALPIALARVGPLAGIGVLITLGLLNMLSVAALAESVARTGSIRYGNVYFGRLVSEYLGAPAAWVATLATTTINAVSVLAYYIGFSSVLSAATGLRAEVWVGALFLIGLFFLSRGSLSSTISSALAIGLVIIGLILVLSVLAAAHSQPANLGYVNLPFLGGRPFDPALLGLIFGVVLLAYFGHVSVGNCGKLVLRRDPGGRSLIWGTVAAQGVAIVLYCIWVLAVNSAIEPQVLADQRGTTLEPLAIVAGPIVLVLGTWLTVLGMGMGTVHSTIGLFNTIREWLPGESRLTLLLARQDGRLLFHSHGKPEGTPRLSLAFVGLERGQPRFSLDLWPDAGTHHTEQVIGDHWEGRGAIEGKLRFVVLDSSPDHARLQVVTSLAVTCVENWETAGQSLLDVLRAPDPEWPLVQWMLRRGEVSLADAAGFLGEDEASARASLEQLVAAGRVTSASRGRETRYRVHLSRRRAITLPEHIWQTLSVQTDADAPHGRGQAHRARNALGALGRVLIERGHFLLCASPVILIFVLAEWLLLTASASFTRVWNLGGVIAVPVFAGIFSVLLLVASRRKGDMVPQVMYRVLGHPLVLGTIYLVFLSGLLAHGLVIWQDPAERLAAMAAGLLVVSVTVVTVRRRAFRRRGVVELCQAPDQAGGRFTVIAFGQLVPAGVCFESPEGEQHLEAASGRTPPFSSLRSAAFQLFRAGAPELKIWAHKVAPDGSSAALPVRLKVQSDGKTRDLDLEVLGGQATLPVKSDSPTTITIVKKEGR
jgi:amino acid permease